MARNSTAAPQYLLEEPTTGLYLQFSPHRIQLSAAPDASSFPTSRAAVLTASARVHDQPHELVRLEP